MPVSHLAPIASLTLPSTSPLAVLSSYLFIGSCSFPLPSQSIPISLELCCALSDLSIVSRTDNIDLLDYHLKHFEYSGTKHSRV